MLALGDAALVGGVRRDQEDVLAVLDRTVGDGGHLLVFALEGARRRGLSTRTRERIQLFGLILLGVITVLALRNDVMRLFFR